MIGLIQPKWCVDLQVLGKITTYMKTTAQNPDMDFSGSNKKLELYKKRVTKSPKTDQVNGKSPLLFCSLVTSSSEKGGGFGAFFFAGRKWCNLEIGFEMRESCCRKMFPKICDLFNFSF